ncbi:cupin domain-containing protein [Zunongwangia sp. F363]|uniref:Cupin domain-containing protein n=1 Tax=Autumnicola tepida TaxID=3075595 RepID=A0ABU3CFN7_9FLAO|nr:cupin domain-containing protein [Zunongwangia sp. F363]MDT0644815.1 cupin domain-containing protein [Zunongwangia sp. F363]
MDFANKVEQSEAIILLEKSDREFISLFKKELLSVEIYKPNRIDKQTPHDRDEFYLIISGEGKFQLQEDITAFKPGDFIYVPAHADHKFIEFSDNFITWVFFIG